MRGTGAGCSLITFQLRRWTDERGCRSVVAAGVRRRSQRYVRVLRPVHPSAGIEVAYRRALVDLVDEMGRAAQECLRAERGRIIPSVAQDAGVADELRVALRDLVSRWGWRFEEASQKLAQYFSVAISDRVAGVLQRILRDGGLAIEFHPTQAQQDVLDATISQNVALIRSVPQRYLAEVEGMVMRSVQAGRDLGVLSRELQAHTGATKRRAALIARDQNNKATAAMARVRQLEAGIDHAVWMHSHAGRVPRPTHVRAGRERTVFSVRDGWFDPDLRVGRMIHPGELINCRCTSRPVIRGLA